MNKILSTNASISHYRIFSKIGAGGMGEAYRAHDSRLDREVAIKLLPPGLANDEERLRRFEQEGKTTSALNHPKSCKENNPILLNQNPKLIRVMSIALWLALVICDPGKIVNSQDKVSPPDPIPKTNKDGPSLKFDFPAMLVGVAEYDEGPTGTTVFYFPKGVKAAVDVRGGAPGELNAAALQLSYEQPKMQAVVFSGGSWYGLSAATGVANGIKELRNAKGEMDFIAGVVGAIIFDVGGRRFSRVTPDDKLGKAALLAAEPGWFPLGARGAGRFAMQGVYYLRGQGADKYANWAHSGQGAAFRTAGPTRIGVFTVVNALGAIVNRSGRVVRCNRNNADEVCPLISEKLKAFPPISTSTNSSGGPTGNTTITLVVTNQKLPFWALQRLAVQVHSSMSRAIQPFATAEDGDILYAVSTDEVDNPSLTPIDLAVMASELAWDAVLSSVPTITAKPAALNVKSGADELRKFIGTYVFPGGGELSIVDAAGSLKAKFKGNGRIYFDTEKDYAITARGNGLFVLESAAQDVLKFEESGGQITGLKMNPGPWTIRAVLRR